MDNSVAIMQKIENSEQESSVIFNRDKVHLEDEVKFDNTILWLDVEFSSETVDVVFSDNPFDKCDHIMIANGDSRWSFRVENASQEELPLSSIQKVIFTDNTFILETGDGEHVSFLKEDIKQNEQSIELDAPPGGIRPPELLKRVLQDTPIPVRDTQGFFGHFRWNYNDVPKSVWDELNPTIAERVKNLHNEGYIRYGSW